MRVEYSRWTKLFMCSSKMNHSKLIAVIKQYWTTKPATFGLFLKPSYFEDDNNFMRMTKISLWKEF